MKTIYQSTLVALLLISPQSWAELLFSQQFATNPVAQGSSTELVFNITNTSPDTAETSIAFSAALPAGLTIAAAPGLDNSCNGTVELNTDSILLSDATLSANSSCFVKLNITTDQPGTFISVSGSLTSTSGDHGSSTDDLTVTASGLDFSLEMTPAEAYFGQSITATYTIEDTGPETLFSNIIFSHDFNGLTPLSQESFEVSGGSCSTSNFTLTDSGISGLIPSIMDQGICTITVDLRAEKTGNLEQKTANLQYGTQSSPALRSYGFTTDKIEIQPNILTLHKSVSSPSSVTPGSDTDIIYRVTNTSRSESLSNIEFDDNLPGTLAGLTAPQLPLSNPCGAGSTITGTSSQISLAGGSLSPGESCEFAVNVAIPAGAPEGEYTSSVQASASTSIATVLSAVIEEPMHVVARPLVTTELSQNIFSSTVDLTYTITNTSSSASLDSFTLHDQLSETVSSASLKETTCPSLPLPFPLSGPSSPSFNSFENTINYYLSEALGAGQSCSFTYTLVFPAGSSGIFETIPVSAPSGEINGKLRLATTERDTGRIVAPPETRLELSSDQVVAGDSVDINIAFLNDESTLPDQDEYFNFSDIEFSLTHNGLLSFGALTDACGGQTSQAGTTIGISALDAGTSCQLTQSASTDLSSSGQIAEVMMQNISATVNGIAVQTADLSKSLRISGLVPEMNIAPGAAEANETSTITLRLQNRNAESAISNLSYVEQVSKYELPFRFISQTAADLCGSGSSLTVTETTLILNSASLLAGQECVISFEIITDPNAPLGVYKSLQANLTYSEEGNSLVVGSPGVVQEVLDTGAIADITESRNLNDSNPDNDPFDTATEQLAGDLNSDGTADAVQSFIASTISPITGRPVGLEVDPLCTILSFEMVPAHELADADPGMSYPEGLARFSISCSESVIRLYLPGADFSGNKVVKKFGPMNLDQPDESQWYKPAGARIDATAEMIELTLVDNQLGDSDPVVGIISDPVGLASVFTRAIPVAGPWWLALMAMQLALLGGILARRGKKRA